MIFAKSFYLSGNKSSYRMAAKNAAEQDNFKDDFPRISPGTGQQDEQDKKRKRVADDVLQIGV